MHIQLFVDRINSYENILITILIFILVTLITLSSKNIRKLFSRFFTDLFLSRDKNKERPVASYIFVGFYLVLLFTATININQRFSYDPVYTISTTITGKKGGGIGPMALS